MPQTRSHDWKVSERAEAGATAIMRDELDDEIDLREYIGIVIKRKQIVLSSCFAVVLITAVWNAFSPEVYEVSAIIGSPVMALTDNGVLELDPIENMKAKIELGVFDAKILQELHIPGADMGFRVFQPRGAKFIKVSLNRTAEQADIGKKTLSKLIEALSSSYAGIIEDRGNRARHAITRLLNRIGRRENSINKNIPNGGDNLSSAIKEDRAEVEGLKLSIDVMRNVVVMQEPFVSPRPIGPRKARNLLLAVVAGLFLGVTSAFAAEYFMADPPDATPH